MQEPTLTFIEGYLDVLKRSPSVMRHAEELKMLNCPLEHATCPIARRLFSLPDSEEIRLKLLYFLFDTIEQSKLRTLASV